MLRFTYGQAITPSRVFKSLNSIYVELCCWLLRRLNVTHALHTPLMSVTNAISGIIIVGAVIQMSNISGFASFLVSSPCSSQHQHFGGFYVTRRMLNMFRKG